MQFVMINEYAWDSSNDKVIISKGDKTLTLAYLLRIEDFNQDNKFNILHNTDSIQIRPKAIYKNEKGYYKKVDNKRIYFTEEETKEIENTIEKFKKYIELKEGK